MRLDILPNATASNPNHELALFANARAEYCALGLEPIVTDLGTAICSPALLPLYDANALFDARLPSGSDMLAEWEKIQAFFSEHRSECLEVRPSVVAAASEVEPLNAFLAGQGWREHRRSVYLLKSAVREDPHKYTIVSARAAGELYGNFTHVVAGENPKLAELSLLKLDDPRYEVLVVLVDRRVVARAGVLSLGEVGLIEQVVVLPDQRGKGLGRIVIQAAIELCVRAQFRRVLLGCDNPAAAALYASIGFEKIGESLEWRAPSTFA